MEQLSARNVETLRNKRAEENVADPGAELAEHLVDTPERQDSGISGSRSTTPDPDPEPKNQLNVKRLSFKVGRKSALHLDQTSRLNLDLDLEVLRRIESSRLGSQDAQGPAPAPAPAPAPSEYSTFNTKVITR